MSLSGRMREFDILTESTNNSSIRTELSFNIWIMSSMLGCEVWRQWWHHQWRREAVSRTMSRTINNELEAGVSRIWASLCTSVLMAPRPSPSSPLVPTNTASYLFSHCNSARPQCILIYSIVITQSNSFIYKTYYIKTGQWKLFVGLNWNRFYSENSHVS